MSTDPSDRAALEREIRARQQHLANTVDELAARVTPKALAQRGADLLGRLPVGLALFQVPGGEQHLVDSVGGGVLDRAVGLLEGVNEAVLRRALLRLGLDAGLDHVGQRAGGLGGPEAADEAELAARLDLEDGVATTALVVRVWGTPEPDAVGSPVQVRLDVTVLTSP